MKRMILQTCWAGSLMLAVALCGCRSRQTQPPDSPTDAASLLTLGPRVGELNPAPNLRIGGAAPQDVAARWPTPSGPVQSARADFGDPKQALGYGVLDSTRPPLKSDLGPSTPPANKPRSSPAAYLPEPVVLGE